MNSSCHDRFPPEKRPEDTMRWDFSDGDPELHVYMNRMQKIGGTVLDLAAGRLRNARQFAAQSMQVYAVDQDGARLRAGLDDIADDATRSRIRTVTADVLDFAKTNILGRCDVVLMSEFLNHAGSRPVALEATRVGYDNVKPGGFMWLRAVSTLDDGFAKLQREAERDPSICTLDDHTFNGICNCSGKSMREPLTYLEPHDLHDVLRDADIVYERVNPTIGYPNIMGGAVGARLDTTETTYGQLSLLVQKPLE